MVRRTSGCNWIESEESEVLLDSRELLAVSTMIATRCGLVLTVFGGRCIVDEADVSVSMSELLKSA
jgi:hypothetical protein